MRIVKCGSWDDLFKLSAVTFLPEEMSRMRQEGIYPVSDPGIAEQDVMPGVKGRKRDIRSIAGSLSLPRILFPQARNLVEIDGRQYYLVDVVPPKPRANPEGSLYLMDIETGLPERKPLLPYQDQLTTLRRNSVRATAEEINAKIRKWNKIVSDVSRLGKASHPSTWALQLLWAGGVVDDRIGEIRSMIEALRGQEASLQEKSKSYEDAVARIEADLRAGRIPSESDQIDHLMFVFGHDPDRAKAIVKDRSAALSEGVRSTAEKLMGVHQEESEKAKGERQRKEEERKRRMEEPLPEYGIPDLPTLEEVSPEDIGSYPKTEKYFGRPSYAKQVKAKVIGLERDLARLTDIRSAIAGLQEFIGRLQEGERSAEFLSTEGKTQEEAARSQEILANIRSFVEKAKAFLRGYASDVFVKDDASGTYSVNRNRFSKSGAGNAQVSVALNQVMNVINNGLRDMHLEPVQESDVPETEGYTYEAEDVAD